MALGKNESNSVRTLIFMAPFDKPNHQELRWHLVIQGHILFLQ